MQQFHQFNFEAMGCEGSLQFYAEPLHAQRVAKLAIAEVFRIQSKYSRFDCKSYLSKVNKAAEKGQTIELDDETAALMNYAFVAYKKSGGLFDVTAGSLSQAWDFRHANMPSDKIRRSLLKQVGMEKLCWNAKTKQLDILVEGVAFDFGGFAKEYAVDAVSMILKQEGIEYGFVEIGGDLVVLGPHADGKPWLIGIRHPRDTEKAIKVVALEKGALATSGDYERFFDVNGKRYCHILNPKTGMPTSGIMSVSVWATSCLVAGTIATIGMLKSAHCGNWLQECGVDYLMVKHDGSLCQSTALYTMHQVA